LLIISYNLTGNGECLTYFEISKQTNILNNTLNYQELVTSLKGGNLLKNMLKLSGSLNKKYLIKVTCGIEHVVFLTHAGMVFT